MALQTGNGVTIVFGTSGFTPNYTRIGGTEMSRESIETTHLGTTDYKTFVPDDLIDGASLAVNFIGIQLLLRFRRLVKLLKLLQLPTPAAKR